MGPWPPPVDGRGEAIEHCGELYGGVRPRSSPGYRPPAPVAIPGPGFTAVAEREERNQPWGQAISVRLTCCRMQEPCTRTPIRSH